MSADDIQKLVNQSNPGDVVQLEGRNYRGPLVLDKPISIEGKITHGQVRTVIYCESSPVVQIDKHQVNLRNLAIRIFNQDLPDRNTQDISIQVADQSTVNFENVITNGRIEGMDDIFSNCEIPNCLDLGYIKPRVRNEFNLKLYVSSACRLISNIDDLFINPVHLTPGLQDISLTIHEIPENYMIYGTIYLQTEKINREIEILGSTDISQSINNSKDSFIWQPSHIPDFNIKRERRDNIAITGQSQPRHTVKTDRDRAEELIQNVVSMSDGDKEQIKMLLGMLGCTLINDSEISVSDNKYNREILTLWKAFCNGSLSKYVLIRQLRAFKRNIEEDLRTGNKALPQTDIPEINLKEPELLAQLESHKGWILSCAFNSDSSQLISVGSDRLAICWDMTGLKELWRKELHEKWITSITFSPDSKIAATGSKDSTICILDTSDNGNIISSLTGHEDSIIKSVISSDGKQLISASLDNTIRLWDISSGRELDILIGDLKKLSRVTFSDDLKHVATATGNGELILWDFGSRQEIWRENNLEYQIKSIAVSPDNEYIAAGCNDRKIRIWSVPEGKAIKTLKGHKDIVNSVSFSNTQYLVSGSHDFSTILWDLTHYCIAYKLDVHMSTVQCTIFNRTGDLLASGGGDSVLNLFRLTYR